MILAKIDVTKVDKKYLFVGTKGKYLDVCLIETPNDQYDNDYMVTQSIPKEDRDRGVKGAILGNARIIGKPRQAPAPNPAPRPAAPAPAPSVDLDSDVPF